ncbi:MAG: hypothetical protein KME07_17935 [Pegethrix bostrychoides GSE-TBD4-15B]|uniref:Uncharacterized protein n=1 Tax=Pegethrix bostrychoides GSE-TBD4-15B TaxID=2839662 RepID=A0A951U660_9CYAN|nr:hypothetical protein [Pegethrix bostrychoides GSE-TBD4-15B]
MAYHFQWPDDLYYWGQNRLGSLVPLLSHLLLKILPLRPVAAVSYVQYSLLLLGFCCFASLCKRLISKLIFALVWFLPLGEFSELLSVGQPYGPQLALIGAACAAMNQIIVHSEQPELKRQVLITLATLSLFLSLWVSDLSVVVLGLLLLFGVGMLAKQIRNPLHQSHWLLGSLRALNVHRFDLPNIAITSGLGLGFVFYAKAHAEAARGYKFLIGTPDQILEKIGRLSADLIHSLTFQTESFFLGLHTLLALGFIGYLAYFLLGSQLSKSAEKTQLRVSLSPWFYLFFSSAVLGFVLLILVDWTYKNPNLRYYTFAYIFSWLTVLVFAEGLKPQIAKQIVKLYTLLALIALTSSLSLPPRTFQLSTKTSTIQHLEPVQSLGNAGLIGSYWTAYLSCAVNPAQLNCTPYDKKGRSPCLVPPQKQQKIGFVRCKRCIAETLDSESIYLIRDEWLDEFPSEIQQFKQCLVKVGEPQKVGPLEMALYRKRSLN